MEHRPSDTENRDLTSERTPAIRNALAVAKRRFQDLAFDPGIRQIAQTEQVLDAVCMHAGQHDAAARHDLAGDIFEILISNLNAAADRMESVREDKNGRRSRTQENESRRFEKKFEIIRKIQDARNTIARLENQRNALDGNAEALKFEERFRLLNRIQETKAGITSLETEKRGIENKGNLATPGELARKLDITANIVRSRNALAQLEEDLASLDAKTKSPNLRHKLEITEQIEAMKHSVRTFENQLAVIHEDIPDETEASLRSRQTRERAISGAKDIIAKNENLLNLVLAPKNDPEASSRSERFSHADEKQTGFKIGPNLSALIEKLVRLGCPDGQKLIFELCECFALFKDILAKRINPEIGAFDRYFLRGAELFDTILSTFRKISVFLKAVGADREQALADQLKLLSLKEHKTPRDYDEIFELTPRLRKIQEARAKISRKLVRIRSAIRMIQEETVRISLRDGYRTHPDLALARFRKLAAKKNETQVHLDVSIRKFEETCAMNKRILDRFEQHSVQHRRHSGN